MSIASRGCCSHRGYLATSRCAATGGLEQIKAVEAERDVLLAAQQVAAPAPAAKQTLKDLGINWADWNPTPPDKNMGLWQDVYLTTSGPVKIRYPAIVTRLSEKARATAELTILAELHNASDKPVEGKFQAEIVGLGLRVEQKESL